MAFVYCWNNIESLFKTVWILDNSKKVELVNLFKKVLKMHTFFFMYLLFNTYNYLLTIN